MSYFLVYDFDYSMEIKRVHEHRKNKQADKKNEQLLVGKRIFHVLSTYFCVLYFFMVLCYMLKQSVRKKKKKQNTLASIPPLILGGRDRFYMSTSVRARCVSPTYIRSHVSKKKKKISSNHGDRAFIHQQ